jgi:hypothetical protein
MHLAYGYLLFHLAAASLVSAQQSLTATTVSIPILTGTVGNPGTILTGTLRGPGTLTFTNGPAPSTDPDDGDGDGDGDDEEDLSGPFTLTAFPPMATQAPCLKTCFNPTSLTDATDCDDVTNDCACFAPSDVLAQVKACVAGCGPGPASLSAASAATSLYSAYCVSMYGQEFLTQDSGIGVTTTSATTTPTTTPSIVAGGNGTVVMTRAPTMASGPPSQSRTGAAASSPSVAGQARSHR